MAWDYRGLDGVTDTTKGCPTRRDYDHTTAVSSKSTTKSTTKVSIIFIHESVQKGVAQRGAASAVDASLTRGTLPHKVWICIDFVAV